MKREEIEAAFKTGKGSGTKPKALTPRNVFEGLDYVEKDSLLEELLINFLIGDKELFYITLAKLQKA